MTAHIVVNNDDDIESSVAQLPDYRAIRTEEDNIKNTMRCIKLTMSIIIVLLCSPFIICDLYYAYTDNSCVHNPTKKSTVDLYTYLLVSGYFGLSVCLLYVATILSIDFEDKNPSILNQIMQGFTYIFMNIFIMFSSAWIIVGGVVFWSEIDNSTCSKPVYSYVMASLIIKIVATFINGVAVSQDKK